MVKKVLVCIAELTWSQGGHPERGERYWYYVDDGKSSCFTNKGCTSIKELAEQLHEGILLSEPLSPKDRLVYEPRTNSEMLYVDGFFGRSAIPSEGYYYESLSRRQIKQLEKHLARLRESEKLIEKAIVWRELIIY